VPVWISSMNQGLYFLFWYFGYS